MSQEQTQNHKCNCTKSIKELKKEIDILKRQIEVLKRAFLSKGV